MQILSSAQKNDITPSQLLSSLDYQIIYAKCGEAIFKMGDTDFILSQKQLLLLTSLEEHTLSVTKVPFEYYSFSVSRDEVKAMFGNPLFASIFLRRSKNSYHIFDFSEGSLEAEAIINQIEKEAALNGNVKNDMLVPLTKLLVLEMYKVNPAPFSNALFANKKMQKIQEYIETHFDENISVDKLAKSIFLTTPYLSHSFKSFSGYSPKQYLTLLRLTKAKQLLLTTNLSVTDICRKIGFTDVNNFIRTFKDFYGKTPKKFRTDK